MPLETPIKCDNCGNEELIHGMKLGRLNGVMGNFGGPGQEPQTMGSQWAVYLCLQCSAIFPYKRHYAGQPQIMAQYEKIYKACRDRIEYLKRLEEIGGQAESVRESRNALKTLPGASGSSEIAISAAIEPILRRLESVEAEQQRKKGGRPAGSKTRPKETA